MSIHGTSQGSQIRARRRALDISQERLSRATDVSLTSIRHAEADVLTSRRMYARIDAALTSLEERANADSGLTAPAA